MVKWILILLFCGNLQILYAQGEDYMSAVYNSSNKKAQKSLFSERADNYLDNFKPDDIKNKVRRSIEDDLEQFYVEFEKQIDEDFFIQDDQFTNYLDKITHKIITANNLKPDYQLFISKDQSLNAFCAFDGTIVVNIGCFRQLRNEAELAAVLCHEISHQLLNHSLNEIIKEHQLAYDKDKRKLIRSLERLEYGSKQKAFDMLRAKLYQSGKLQRQNEIEADSMGYVLYKKTDYSEEDYIGAIKYLQLYDSIDISGVEDSTYVELFDLSQIEFKDSWLDAEDLSAYDYGQYQSELNEDSLISHPSFQLRKEKLNTYFPELNVDVTPSEPDSNFIKLKHLSSEYFISSLIDIEEYGLATYFSMLHYQYGYETEEALERLGESFEKMAEARENYELNRYVATVKPDHSDSYQKFLNFIWNLRLEEMKEVARHYSTSN